MDDLSQPSGRQLKSLRNRDESYNEFVGLLARHDQAIRRFVRSLLPTRDGVDDVMQDTALECWRKFSDFAPEHPDDAVHEFIRWACVIARFKALSWQRDKGRDRLVFRDNVVETLAADSIQLIDQQDDERLAVECCLGKLQDADRRLVLSVHSPGQSVANIAAETGEKARRLYSRMNMLRRTLLDCVQQQLQTKDTGNG